MHFISSFFIISAVLCASGSVAAPAPRGEFGVGSPGIVSSGISCNGTGHTGVNSTNVLAGRAPPPAVQAPLGNGIIAATPAQKNAAKAFVSSLPMSALQDAGSTGAIGTIYSADANGNTKNPRPSTGFRLDRQSTPSGSSGLVANVQVQINGISGTSTIGGVLLQGAAIPPLTIKAKLIDSINRGSLNTIAAPQPSTTSATATTPSGSGGAAPKPKPKGKIL